MTVDPAAAGSAYDPTSRAIAPRARAPGMWLDELVNGRMSTPLIGAGESNNVPLTPELASTDGRGGTAYTPESARSSNHYLTLEDLLRLNRMGEPPI